MPCRSTRKVKCDEARPSCGKCVSSGRSCDGYIPGTSTGNDTELRTRPLLPLQGSRTPSASPPATRPSSPFSKLRATAYERHAFDFFVENTAIPLWIILPCGDWVYTAMQLALDEPTVFLAIAAVGSAHSHQTRIMHHSFARQENMSPDDLTVHQYCKATRALQEYIDNAIQRGATIEPLLLACVFFVIFETSAGNASLAMTHLRYGQRAFQSSHILKQRSPDVTAELLGMFERLAYESIYGKAIEPASQNYEQVRIPSSSVETSPNDKSLQAMKETLDSLITATSEWQTDLLRMTEASLSNPGWNSFRPAVRYCITHCMSRTLTLESYPELLERKRQLLRQHRQWFALFKTMHRADIALQNRSRVMMEIQHFVSAFTMEDSSRKNCLNIDERQEDKFAHILNLAQSFIQETGACSEHYEIGGEPRQSISLELGLLPALYLVCLKAGTPELRDRALDLLRQANRREGLYLSRHTALYAEAMMWAANERRPACMAPATQLSPFTDVVSEDSSHHITLICGRLRHEKSGGLEIVEYRASDVLTPRFTLIKEIPLPGHS